MTDDELRNMFYRQYDSLPGKSAGAMWNAATPACEYCSAVPYLGSYSLHSITFLILHAEDSPRYVPGSPVPKLTKADP
jgi:hypothetical protein